MVTMVYFLFLHVNPSPVSAQTDVDIYTYSFSSNIFRSTDGSLRKRKSRPQASLTATHSSTLAEEIVAVLRTLHSLHQWNGLINEYVNSQLNGIGNVMAGRASEAVRCGNGFTHKLLKGRV